MLIDKRGLPAPSPLQVGPARARRARSRRNVRLFRRSDTAGQRCETEETLSQRLYAILLAVHAAEANLSANPDRLAAILDLIHTQSAASLEDVRRLGGLR